MSEAVVVRLKPGADLAGFRAAVRGLVHRRAPPEQIDWRTEDGLDLFDAPASLAGPPIALPRTASELIATVALHRDPDRHPLLYRLVWRILHGEKALMQIGSDPLVWRLQRMAKSVRRDEHKMHAFVRFRRVAGPEDGGAGGERFVAWFEPEHFILEAVAEFFATRFPSLHWTILTPQGRLCWDRESLHVGPPATRAEAPAGDDGFEAHWVGYYESTFNPARTNTALMRKEMPRRYWRNLPEAASIGRLTREASARTTEMVARAPSEPRKRNPDRAVAAMADQAPTSLAALNALIAGAQPPAPFAPRAVLGEGPQGAAIALVGEQPGDQEDLAGRPFVGPAGQVLDRALAEAGLSRAELYVTNAVKHFKHELRGKRRLHQTPTAGEIKHYRWWLMQELAFVRPRLVVALGASAALALSGRKVSVASERGPADFGGQAGFVTVHPSYLLRLPAPAQADARVQFVADLRRAREMARNLAAPAFA